MKENFDERSELTEERELEKPSALSSRTLREGSQELANKERFLIYIRNDNEGVNHKAVIPTERSDEGSQKIREQRDSSYTFGMTKRV